MRIALQRKPFRRSPSIGVLRMKSEKDDELLPLEELRLDEAPAGVDRRAFMMRSALVGAVAKRCAA